MLKKLAVGCLLVVAITGVALYFAWRQATRLPDWYGEPQRVASAETPPAAAEADRAGPSAAAAAADGSPGPAVRSAPAPPAGASRPAATAGRPRSGRIELDEPQLNDLLRRSLDEHPQGRRLKRAVKAVRASIDGDRLELGVVANLADLGAAAETDREAGAVRRLARLAPWLGDRDVYLAVRGRPRARDGHLVFDRDGELKVGGITFDIADVASRLGVPEERLDRGLELPLSGMTVEDVEVAGGRLVLSLAEGR